MEADGQRLGRLARERLQRNLKPALARGIAHRAGDQAQDLFERGEHGIVLVRRGELRLDARQLIGQVTLVFRQENRPDFRRRLAEHRPLVSGKRRGVQPMTQG